MQAHWPCHRARDSGMRQLTHRAWLSWRYLALLELPTLSPLERSLLCTRLATLDKNFNSTHRLWSILMHVRWRRFSSAPCMIVDARMRRHAGSVAPRCFPINMMIALSRSGCSALLLNTSQNSKACSNTLMAMLHCGSRRITLHAQLRSSIYKVSGPRSMLASGFPQDSSAHSKDSHSVLQQYATSTLRSLSFPKCVQIQPWS